MKKFCSVIVFAVLIFSFAATAFASDRDFFEYASENEISAMLENSESLLAKCLDEYEIEIDPSVVMPVFYANLTEYAKSGEFEYEPHLFDGKQLYACDVFDKTGNHAGYITFTEDDIIMFASGGSEIGFSANASKFSAFKPVSFAKFMFAEGAGYVYYAENSFGKYLIKSDIKGANEEFFSFGKVFTLGEQGLSFAKELFLNQIPEKIPAGENPPTGAAVPGIAFATMLFLAFLPARIYNKIEKNKRR